MLAFSLPQPQRRETTRGLAQACLDRGLAAHRGGNLTEARTAYMDALRADPNCVDPWHLLGVICLQLGEAAAAVPLIARAIQLDPSQAAYFNNLGNALFKQHNLQDAETMYQHAVALQPRYAEAIYNLGNTLQILERYDEAIGCYERAVSLKLDYRDALYSGARLFERRGQYESACDWYRRVLAFDSGHCESHLYLGRLLFLQDRVDEALAHYADYRRSARAQSSSSPQTTPLLLELSSVKQWCARSGARYQAVRPEREQPVPTPQFSHPVPQMIEPSRGVLHELYLAEVRDATVIGWHDAVLADSQRVALYDMAGRNNDDAIEVEHGGIRYASGTRLLLDDCPTGTLPVRRGVLLAGRGRDSFAHWLIDFLPRLWILDQFPEYADWPLLVDAGLYPQQLESLERLNRHGRPIVTLGTDTRYAIDRVVLISDLSCMRRQTYRPFAVPSGQEAIVAPEALTYLRQTFAPEANERAGARRLYVSRRRQTQFRRMRNEPEIEQLFAARGFEIVLPELLSFEEQVRLFSQAAVVAGAAGSNLINMVFSPAGTQILVLTQWHPGLNYHFFSHLAALNGQRLEYVLGDVVERHAYHYQHDFVIDPGLVSRALDRIL